MKPPVFAPLAPMGLAVTLYLAAFGAALVGLQTGPGRGVAALCAAPAALAAVLAFTSQADRQQYIARLLAAALMLPILLLMALLDDLPGAASATLALLHAATSVAGVFGLASATTRVAPPAGTPRLQATALLTRLQALPLVVTRDGSGCTWVVEHAFGIDETRSHRVLLDIDPRRGTVFVREQLGATAAAPRGADEASMRALVDEAFDATRPDAQRVWLRRWQASILQPQQLATAGPARDADGVVLQLCQTVLRCGWVWQPVLLKKCG